MCVAHVVRMEAIKWLLNSNLNRCSTVTATAPLVAQTRSQNTASSRRQQSRTRCSQLRPSRLDLELECLALGVPLGSSRRRHRPVSLQHHRSARRKAQACCASHTIKTTHQVTPRREVSAARRTSVLDHGFNVHSQHKVGTARDRQRPQLLQSSAQAGTQRRQAAMRRHELARTSAWPFWWLRRDSSYP